MINYFFKGGLMMWPLLALSISALGIILEKFFLLGATRKAVSQSLAEIKKREILVKKDFQGLILLCQKNKNILAEIFTAGLKKATVSKEAVKEALEFQGRQEIRVLENRLDWLATIAGAAPLLGFLGTVTGMVKAFQVIEKVGAAVNAQVLAAGIWEALITTVFGLSIAIPCVFAYNYFVNTVQNLVLDLEAASNELIENFMGN